VKVNDHQFRLPARYYKYFPPDYEQTNFSFFKKICKPGMTIIDIGAHIGLFSTYMQQLSNGHVYSFEPTPSTLALLKKTIALNQLQNKIDVIAAAVSDKNGKANFSIDPEPASVSNSLVQYQRTANLQTCEVDVVTIDDFIKTRGLKINFMKIDAEGAELAVLKGARNTINTQRPIMILALHPSAIVARKETNEMIWLFLKEINYTISCNGQEISKNEFCEKGELFDVHLIPMEQVQ
jgi:FkbM family methyltransferase